MERQLECEVDCLVCGSSLLGCVTSGGWIRGFPWEWKEGVKVQRRPGRLYDICKHLQDCLCHQPISSNFLSSGDQSTG